jgi:hypothetical protein
MQFRTKLLGIFPAANVSIFPSLNIAASHHGPFDSFLVGEHCRSVAGRCISRGPE